MVNGIMNFEFQDNCVEFLMDKTLDPESKQIITIKAPTGAGKTVILIKYIDEYLKNTNGNTAFVWLCLISIVSDLPLTFKYTIRTCLYCQSLFLTF